MWRSESDTAQRGSARNKLLYLHKKLKSIFIPVPFVYRVDSDVSSFTIMSGIGIRTTPRQEELRKHQVFITKDKKYIEITLEQLRKCPERLSMIADDLNDDVLDPGYELTEEEWIDLIKRPPPEIRKRLAEREKELIDNPNISIRVPCRHGSHCPEKQNCGYDHTDKRKYIPCRHTTGCRNSHCPFKH